MNLITEDEEGPLASTSTEEPLHVLLSDEQRQRRHPTLRWNNKHSRTSRRICSFNKKTLQLSAVVLNTSFHAPVQIEVLTASRLPTNGSLWDVGAHNSVVSSLQRRAK